MMQDKLYYLAFLYQAITIRNIFIAVCVFF